MNPPLRESLVQLGESMSKGTLNQQKIRAGLNKLQGPYLKNAGAHLNPDKYDPDPRTAVAHEGPGTWVKGCFMCNVASNIAYACDTDYDRKCLIKEDPLLSSIDSMFWDKIMPAMLAFTDVPSWAGTPEPTAYQKIAMKGKKKKN